MVLSACAGGSGSSGFDNFPSSENAAIDQALSEQAVRCLPRIEHLPRRHDGRTDAAADAAPQPRDAGRRPLSPTRSPPLPTPCQRAEHPSLTATRTDATPTPHRRSHKPHKPVVDTGINDGAVPCATVDTTNSCLFVVPFAPDGFPLGTVFRVAVRTVEPTGRVDHWFRRDGQRLAERTGIRCPGCDRRCTPAIRRHRPGTGRGARLRQAAQQCTAQRLRTSATVVPTTPSSPSDLERAARDIGRRSCADTCYSPTGLSADAETRDPHLDPAPGKTLSNRLPPARESGGIGRRAGFRILWGNTRGGSSPPFRISSSRIHAASSEIVPHDVSKWGTDLRRSRPEDVRCEGAEPIHLGALFTWSHSARSDVPTWRTRRLFALQPRRSRADAKRRRHEGILRRVQPAHANPQARKHRYQWWRSEFGSTGSPLVFVKTFISGLVCNG